MATSKRKKKGLSQRQDNHLEADPSMTEDSKDHPSQTSNPNIPSSSTIAKAVAIDTLSNESNILESPIVKQIISIAAGYGLFFGAFKSFKAFRKSFRELRHEWKTKNPEESAENRKQRVMEKVWECVKHAASFTGYVASILSLVAAISNPFGLAIAGSTVTIITAVGLGAAFVAVLAEKLAEKKIASIRAFLSTVKEVVDQSDFKDHSHAKRFRKIHDKLEKVQNIYDKVRGISQAYRDHGHENPALFLIKKVHEHEGLLLKATHPIGGEYYEHIATSTLKTLESLKNDPNPIYRGISFDRKMMAEDQQELLIKVPRIKKAAHHATDTVLEHPSTPTTEPADHIRCFKDHHDHIQIHTNADPSDETLCLMMAAVAPQLGPLKMKPGGDIERILRVLEAAKLADVELIIHPDDRARIQAAEPPLKDYFDALLRVSTRKFQAYVEKEVKAHGKRALGQIPDSIPSHWKNNPKPQETY